jgi:hypothetical protein
MIQVRLGDLERQHRHLEDEIAEAMCHCSVDDLAIVELKRQKLRVKDRIEYFRHHPEALVI